MLKAETKGPPVVQCGMYVNEFSEFSIITNQFTVDVFVWFVFYPSRIDKDMVEAFTFERGTIVSKEKQEMKFIGERLFTQYKVRVKFTSSLFFRDFPFDDHRIYLTLINDQLSPDEMNFSGSVQTFHFNPELQLSGWDVINANVRAGVKSAVLDRRAHEHIEYPCLTFSLDLKRRGIRQALIIILPMLGMFFIAYISLSFVHIEIMPKINVVNIPLGSIMGLLAYRFVLENITPKVGYFTLTDHMFFIFLTNAFMVFLIKLYIALADYSLETNMLINEVSMVVIPAIFFTFFFVIINYKQSARRKHV